MNGPQRTICILSADKYQSTMYVASLFAGQLKEIVKRLREAGRITDALKYADGDTHPELRANILVDLARCSVLQINAGGDKTELENVKKQLTEAIDLVKGYLLHCCVALLSNCALNVKLHT